MHFAVSRNIVSYQPDLNLSISSVYNTIQILITMQLLNLLCLAVASSASAIPGSAETNSGAQAATGVVVYENVQYQGFAYEIPSTGRCWTLPEPLARQVSSIRFRAAGVSCALYKNNYCLPPPVYSGLRESVPDLQSLGINDEVKSVFCSLYDNEE